MYFCLKRNTGYCCCQIPKLPFKSSHPHLLNSFYFSTQGCFFLLTRSNFFTSVFISQKVLFEYSYFFSKEWIKSKKQGSGCLKTRTQGGGPGGRGRKEALQWADNFERHFEQLSVRRTISDVCISRSQRSEQQQEAFLSRKKKLNTLIIRKYESDQLKQVNT